jgi:hypothetical protein
MPEHDKSSVEVLSPIPMRALEDEQAPVTPHTLSLDESDVLFRRVRRMATKLEDSESKIVQLEQDLRWSGVGGPCSTVVFVPLSEPCGPPLLHQESSRDEQATCCSASCTVVSDITSLATHSS